MHDATVAQRPLWLRILQHPLVRLVLIGGPLFLMMALTSYFTAKVPGEPLKAIGIVIVWAALGIAVYLGLVRLIERRRPAELSLSRSGRELGIGAAVGAGLYTVCVLILMVLGIYRIDGLNPWSYMLPAVAMALSSGILEELVFRAVLFRVVEEWLGSWVSLAVSSLVFGFVHLINPAATVLGAVFISVEAGLLLAAAYMLTRRLWMSIGFHIAWNYTQSGIFSGIVSGGDTDPGLLKSNTDGPVLLTGGTVGLEASLTAFVLCTATGIVLLVLAIRRGHLMRPFGRKPA